MGRFWKQIFFLADKIVFEIRKNKWTEGLVMKNKGREPETWGSALIWGLFSHGADVVSLLSPGRCAQRCEDPGQRHPERKS